MAPLGWGCFGILLLYTALAAAIVVLRNGNLTFWAATLIFGPAIVVLSLRIYPIILLLLANVTWPKDRRAVVVYSDSPHWKEYIEAAWLPRISHQAVVLNWSHRKTWSSTIEVRLFRYFVGTSQNYNPSVLVLRGFRSPIVFRFFYAFRDQKHGDSSALSRLEQELFREFSSPTA